MLAVSLFAAVLCFASASSASAEVRTAIINDGPDPGARYDVQQVVAQFNRETQTLDVTFRLYSPAPANASAGSYMVAWVRANPDEESADGCDLSLNDAAGDSYINLEQRADGSYEATTNVKFRREYNTVTPSVSADGLQISVHISDVLYANWSPRCLTADSEGQGTYDPSQPNGGPSGDSLDSTFFQGYGPPGTPTAPRAQCDDGIDNDQDGKTDLADPQCGGDKTHNDEAHYARIRSLTRSAAQHYAAIALRRKFGSAFRYGSGRRVACRRVGRLRERCKVSWFAGDVSWSGKMEIWYARDSAGAVWWNYNLRIVRVAVSCGIRGCKTHRHVIRVR